MNRRLHVFNIYYSFAIALLVLLSSSCKTTEQKTADKEASLFRIHLQSSVASQEKGELISVNRESPVELKVDPVPIVDEASIVSASVVPSVGGFSIRVEYDGHGRIALENLTAANRGRRLAIFCQWTETRWLAAPLISKPIRDGIVIFTPDATLGESDRIVRGINNLVKKLRK